MGPSVRNPGSVRPVAELVVASLAAAIFLLSVAGVLEGPVVGSVVILLALLVLDVPRLAIGDLQAPWANVALAAAGVGLYLGLDGQHVLSSAAILLIGTILATWAVVRELGGHLTLGRMSHRAARVLEGAWRRVSGIADHRVVLFWGLIDRPLWPSLRAGLVVVLLIPYLVGMLVAIALQAVFLDLQAVSAITGLLLTGVAIVRWSRGSDRVGGSVADLLRMHWWWTGLTVSRVVSTVTRPLGGAAVGLLVLASAPPLLLLLAALWVPWRLVTGHLEPSEVVNVSTTGAAGGWLAGQLVVLALGLLVLFVPAAYAVVLVRAQTKESGITLPRRFLGHLGGVAGVILLAGSADLAGGLWSRLAWTLGVPDQLLLPALAVGLSGSLVLGWALYEASGSGVRLDGRRERWLWVGLGIDVTILYLVLGWGLAVAVLATFLLLSVIWWAYVRYLRAAFPGDGARGDGAWSWAGLVGGLVALYGAFQWWRGSPRFGGSVLLAGSLMIVFVLARTLLGWERMAPLLWYGLGFTIRPPDQHREAGRPTAPAG